VSTKKWMALSLALSLLIVAVLAMNKWMAPPAVVGAAPGKGPGLFSAQVPGSDLAAASAANFGLDTLRPMGKQPSPMDALVPPSFQADAQGRLLLNGQARNDVEQVAALFGHDEAVARLNEATKGLPPQAQRDARDLYLQYVQYAQALTQAMSTSPDEVTTLEQARAQFETIKKLREQYFGANTDALFKQDQQLTDQILDYAAQYLKQHPNAPLLEATGYGQEKVLAAQEAAQKAASGAQP
jgi:hypothetical protein